jgi:hypothetical protein
LKILKRSNRSTICYFSLSTIASTAEEIGVTGTATFQGMKAGGDLKEHT